jgi:hypothetical protein
VPKSNKFTSKVPDLTDYKPSFVNEDGEITDVKAAIKAFHTLMVDKAKAQDAREDAQVETTEITAERDSLQSKIDSSTDPDTRAELERANKRVAKAEADKAASDLRADRIEVAAELGLTPKQAKRLQGSTKEELEADAKELLEDLGIKPGAQQDDDDDDDDDSGRTTPRSTVPRLTNGGDIKNGADAEPDYEAAAARISGARVL